MEFQRRRSRQRLLEFCPIRGARSSPETDLGAPVAYVTRGWHASRTNRVTS